MTSSQAFDQWIRGYDELGNLFTKKPELLRQAFLAGFAARVSSASSDLKDRITDARANSWGHEVSHLMIVRRDEFNALLKAASDASVGRTSL